MFDLTETPGDRRDVTDPISLERWNAVRESARSVVPTVGSYVVVAPHPDDEILTVGGLISLVNRSGGDIRVLAVTDGGNAYPDHFEQDRLATQRRAEQMDALAAVGISADRVRSLGIDDGSVPAHEDELVQEICEISDASTTIVAPWIGDVHSDHEAVGRAAVSAARAVGCALWFSLFWAWHRRDPEVLADTNLVRIEHDSVTLASKRAALQCHASQLRPPGIDPMLDDALLEPARWPAEYFIVADGVLGDR